jgi:hypothetical protein
MGIVFFGVIGAQEVIVGSTFQKMMIGIILNVRKITFEKVTSNLL